MNWEDIDNRQRERGYHLQLNFHYGEWNAIYTSMTDLPGSARADNFEDAIRGAAEKTGWEGE